MTDKTKTKEKLDSDLHSIHFTKQENVLQKLKEKEQRTKWHRFWNKEISIPVIPVSTVFITGLAIFTFIGLNGNKPVDDEPLFIEFGGSTYLQQQFERKIENES
ncbi:hypothetical protein [Oceanobacillus neutriphilus]|uniref:Uncharacterized protein n=1 Tax=Oceanobacillus neutriphilus TaxID=531815 RepID=A0ABQ2NRU1_9BACI|nr:hypothetical protein [Oceanobacillus neutriphilus]GGP09633.1 hypothetical protein GCM10011346_14650 [Oceanobacillus neutriphilus]